MRFPMIMLATAAALASTAARAMPLDNLTNAAPSHVTQARLVCTPAGRCYHTYPPAREMHHVREVHHVWVVHHVREVHHVRPVPYRYGHRLAPTYGDRYGRRFEPDYGHRYGRRFEPDYGVAGAGYRPFAYGPGYYAAEVYGGCGPYTCAPAYTYTYSAAYGLVPSQWTGTTFGVGFGF